MTGIRVFFNSLDPPIDTAEMPKKKKKSVISPSFLNLFPWYSFSYHQWRVVLVIASPSLLGISFEFKSSIDMFMCGWVCASLFYEEGLV